MVAYVSRPMPFVWDPDPAVTEYHKAKLLAAHPVLRPACGAPHDVTKWVFTDDPPEGRKLCDACRKIEDPKVVTA